MNIQAREQELRDRLHEAIDNMSLFEIIVLIFLVQTVRLRLAATRAVKALKPGRKPGVVFISGDDAVVTVTNQDGEQIDFRQAIAEQMEVDVSWEHVGVQGFQEDYWRQRREMAQEMPYYIPEPAFVYGLDETGRYRPITASFDISWHPGVPSGYCTPSRSILTGSGESAGREYWSGGNVQ